MAVADLSVELYTETMVPVFPRYALRKGELMFRSRRENPSAIRRSTLLTVEGRCDNICANGQTLAAQDLTPSLRL